MGDRKVLRISFVDGLLWIDSVLSQRNLYRYGGALLIFILSATPYSREGVGCGGKLALALQFAHGFQ